MGLLKSCCAYSCRYGNFDFASVPRTKTEEKAIGHLGTSTGGFLVWRKTLLVPSTVCLIIATILQIILTIVTYSRGQTSFFISLLGQALWDQVFCPPVTRGRCATVPGLEGVFWVILITDILLGVISLVACILLVRACYRWADYVVSYKTLRTAFGAMFLAPFALLLLLPPAAFINPAATQTHLCQVQLQQYFPDQASGLTLTEDVCAQPIEDWATALNATLSEQGRLRDPYTGTCPHAQAVLAEATIAFLASGASCDNDNAAIAGAGTQLRSCTQAVAFGLCTAETASWREGVLTACPLACGLCTPPPPAATCQDRDRAFAAVAVADAPASCADAVNRGLCTATSAEVRDFVRDTCPLGCGLCQGECADNDVAFTLAGGSYASVLRNCARATAVRWPTPAAANPFSMCNSNNATIRDFVRGACPLSCNVCSAPAGRRRLQAPIALQGALQDAVGQAGGGGPLTLQDGCVDPIVLQAVAVLEVTLSDEVIIGSFALRRGSTVMLALIPAALGLALGAGQGSTLSKALLPSSRLPARLASIVVGLSLPVLASLLGVLNQLLASQWGTLACICILAMLGVWLPLGVLGQCKKMSIGKAKQTTHPIIDPATAAVVVKAIGVKKNLVTGWMLAAVLCIVGYLSFSAAYSMVTEQLAEFQRTWAVTVRQATVGDQYFPLLSLVFTVMSTVLSVVAKTYLAQAFYTDAAVTSVVSIWHTEKSDSPEVCANRAAELAEVAEALSFSAASRQMTERPKSKSKADDAMAAQKV